jgi:hypothetical protein
LLPTIRLAVAAVDAAPAVPDRDRAPWAIDEWDPELL